MAKKIAIVTHYWKSYNFGGNLQAYALPIFLNKNGFDAKQICYNVKIDTSKSSKIHKFKLLLKNGFIVIFKKSIRCIIKHFIDLFHRKEIKNMNQIRFLKYKSCLNFQTNLIPHTDKEYFDENLEELNDEVDFFITGSDQVFNYNYFKEGYWLKFARKTKISYAASMAMDYIPNERKKFTKESLSSFKAIGVREEKTVELYSALLNRKVVLNIDPTLLLTSSDWDEISSNKIIDGDYVFCYFLGNNKIERKLAKEFAIRNNLKLVCIPFYETRYKLNDMNYGDINLPYASIEDFISLIKYANYVFTDSFHATVFSMIYHREYVVFNRDFKGSMNSRIISLTKLFHTEFRFLNTIERCNINELEKILKEDTSYISKEFDELREASIKYLLDNLE